MEQANDIKITGNLLVEGTSVDMTTTAQLATVYHLIADTGVVHQNTTGPMTMTMTIEGQSIIIKITINQSELNLSDIDEGGIGKADDYIFSDHSITSQINHSHWKNAQIIAWTLLHHFKL